MLEEDTLEKLAQEKRGSIVFEFVEFLKQNKKWWLAPILVVMLLLGALVLLSSSTLAPFLYPLF